MDQYGGYLSVVLYFCNHKNQQIDHGLFSCLSVSRSVCVHQPSASSFPFSDNTQRIFCAQFLFSCSLIEFIHVAIIRNQD